MNKKIIKEKIYHHVVATLHNIEDFEVIQEIKHMTNKCLFLQPSPSFFRSETYIDKLDDFDYEEKKSAFKKNSKKYLSLGMQELQKLVEEKVVKSDNNPFHDLN